MDCVDDPQLLTHEDEHDSYSLTKIKDYCAPFKIVDDPQVPKSELYSCQIIDELDEMNVKDVFVNLVDEDE